MEKYFPVGLKLRQVEYKTSELRWILDKLCHNVRPKVDWDSFAAYLPRRTAEQVQFLWEGVEDSIRGRLSEDWMVPEGEIPILKPKLLVQVGSKHKRWIPFRKDIDEHRLAPRQWSVRFDQAIFIKLDRQEIMQIMERVMLQQRKVAAMVPRSPITLISSEEFSYWDRMVRKRAYECQEASHGSPVKQEPREVKSPPATAVKPTAASPPSTATPTNTAAADLPNKVTPDESTTKRQKKNPLESTAADIHPGTVKRSLFQEQTAEVSSPPRMEDQKRETEETRAQRPDNAVPDATSEEAVTLSPHHTATTTVAENKDDAPSKSDKESVATNEWQDMSKNSDRSELDSDDANEDPEAETIMV